MIDVTLEKNIPIRTFKKLFLCACDIAVFSGSTPPFDANLVFSTKKGKKSSVGHFALEMVL